MQASASPLSAPVLAIVRTLSCSTTTSDGRTANLKRQAGGIPLTDIRDIPEIYRPEKSDCGEHVRFGSDQEMTQDLPDSKEAQSPPSEIHDEGRTGGDVARHVDVPLATVTPRAHHALRALRLASRGRSRVITVPDAAAPTANPSHVSSEEAGRGRTAREVATSRRAMDGVGQAGRLQETGSSLFGPLFVTACEPRLFRYEFDSARADDVVFARISTSPCTVRLASRLIGSGDPEEIKLVLQTAGRSEFEQDGRQCVLAPGDLSVFASDRPYAFTLVEPYEVIVVGIPCGRFGGHAMFCAGDLSCGGRPPAVRAGW